MIDDVLAQRKKKALAITISIQPEKVEDDKALDQPPKLEEKSEDDEVKESMLKGHEQDLKRKKRDGARTSFDDKVLMGMMKES